MFEGFFRGYGGDGVVIRNRCESLVPDRVMRPGLLRPRGEGGIGGGLRTMPAVIAVILELGK